MFYFPLCNQRHRFLSFTPPPPPPNPFRTLRGGSDGSPEDVYPHGDTAALEKVFLKQTKQLVDIWLDVPQALDEKYCPYVATAACPAPTDNMSVSHPFKGRPDLERHPVGP